LACTSRCSDLIQFTPSNIPGSAGYDWTLGYADYAENGETERNQYRSWLRRDAAMAIQYAAAVVACRSQDWRFGISREPIGLIDMSERDGSIPGTSVGSPGHPEGTHTDGFDIDMAYYQLEDDNRARPVCDHTSGGADAYHCTSDPYLLDPWRTALFLGALGEYDHVRIIGVDGRVGPVVEGAFATLCEDGWIDAAVCRRGMSSYVTYETTDTGRGWYYFHHHHVHVSFSASD
jgi:hypothetical protein